MATFFEEPPIVGIDPGNDELAGFDFTPPATDGLDFPTEVGAGTGNSELAGFDFAPPVADGLDFPPISQDPGYADVAGFDYADPSILPNNEPISDANAAAGLDFPPPTNQGAVQQTQDSYNTNNSSNIPAQKDWRVRLSLAPGSDYLYKSSNPGILEPLIDTDGIIFPYVPSINVTYMANYDPTEIIHSNYKIQNYRSSAVESINITCDFTAQDTTEASYLLAVIHFLKSCTKMFYGQDKSPIRGTPPPLCYLTGMGAYQFDQHPLAINSFNYVLPTDVDYIRADINDKGTNTLISKSTSPAQNRLGFGIMAGGYPTPAFSSSPSIVKEPTYIPTKMQIQFAAIPIISRNAISNNFSLEKYGTGELLRGSKNPKVGGIW